MLDYQAFDFFNPLQVVKNVHFNTFFSERTPMNTGFTATFETTLKC